MINYIDLTTSPIKKLPYLSDMEYQKKFKKGWSYSYVYHFSEIRNIYILIKKFGYKDLKSFTTICIQNKLPSEKTPWNERRILEHVNALKNFGLLSEDVQPLRADIFAAESLNSALTVKDFEVFGEIFFSYYRFKEILSWFIDPIAINREKIIDNISKDNYKHESLTIFPFASKDRFTDSLIFELNSGTTIFKMHNNLDENNEDMIRFWDVFVKWALELNYIEKFNLKNLDFQFANNYKSLSCIYFKKAIPQNFDLLYFLKTNYNSNYINVPRLIFRIATEYRYSIEDIKNLIIKTSNENRQKLSLQRTSEIFIRDTEIKFVPKVNDSYISHLLIS